MCRRSPPANPGCKILRSGGYFGRKTKTDVQTSTLYPVWDEARNPLAYLGTRSELENEVLRVRVYDWDRLSADDLIGQADVPLNGLLEYGQASSRFASSWASLLEYGQAGRRLSTYAVRSQ